MAEQQPINIFVLGPMKPVEDEDGRLEREARTINLKQVIEEIARDIEAEHPDLAPIEVAYPEQNLANTIIPGIIAKLERADLVILDLTGAHGNVMYELGLVHAMGLPYILVTGDSRAPFYVTTVYYVSRFPDLTAFDRSLRAHRDFRNRIFDALRLLRGQRVRDAEVEDLTKNPVTEYFDGLPIVDISAPAGLAAGYWMNGLRRFVRHGGYFEAPDRTVTLQGLDGPGSRIERPLRLGQFVAVQPIGDLRVSQDTDSRHLADAIAQAGYGLIEGGIHFGAAQDLRFFGTKFLAHRQVDGTLSLVEPGVIVEIPSTLYALQYSPRTRILDGLRFLGMDPAEKSFLLARRYRLMMDRFGKLIRLYLRGEDARGHHDQVHYVTISELPAKLRELAPPP